MKLDKDRNSHAVIPPIRRQQRETGLSFSLDVSTNDAYGSSTADVLQMALTEHRDFSLRATMSEIAAGDYVEAFLAYSDYQTCNELLDEMLKATTVLSCENHHVKNSPTSVKSDPDEVQSSRQQRFQWFLDEFSLTVPIEPEAV